MIRTAFIFSGALASAPIPQEDLAKTVASMEANMEARFDTQKTEMESRIKELESKLAKKTDNARRLYNAAFLDDTKEDDVTGTMSFIPEITTAMGTTWTILCGALVFFMNAGFALLESGLCRAVSCQSVFLKNMLDACFGTILWFLCGYGFMYGSMAEGDDGTPLMVIGGIDNGMAGMFGDGMVDSTADVVVGMGYVGPNHLITCQDWFFQWAFCVTAATIVSGGVAERLQMGGYLVFTTFMTAFIYPTVGAMTWGYGFLYD